MSSTTKQTVFLVSTTGKTCGSIVECLPNNQTNSEELNVVIRSSSVDKSFIKEPVLFGVKIITGDIVKDTQDTLEAHLKDVATVIIASVPLPEGHQDNLICAAKAAGVKRVVPSDFASYAPPGSMQGQDMKVGTHQFIIDNDIPHTFILVGIWPVAVLPLPHAVDGRSVASFFQKQFHGLGNIKTSWTALERVGDFVTYDGEATLGQMYALASKVTGENFDDYHKPKFSSEEVESKCGKDFPPSIPYEYSRSIWFRVRIP
ncbi:hypothetical protein PM082_014506 [Marasmius tenuissimus]|nr:hypothetical protein PM082_014506 [Marasmius tenuissimus]